MPQVIAIVVGLAVGFVLSRALRRPTSTAGAASVARSAAASVGGRRGLSLPALQRSVLSEMYRYIGRAPDGRGAVPDSFLIHLHPNDEVSVQEAPDFFRRGLLDAIMAEASRQGWHVPGHIRIETVADPGRHQGSPAVTLFDPGAPPPAPVAPTGYGPPPAPVPPPQATAMFAPPADPDRTAFAAPGDADLTATSVVPAAEDSTVAMGAAAAAADVPAAFLERADQPDYRHPLGAGRLVIGRSKTADIQVDDSRVSRAHLAIAREGRRWTATDEGSSNGSWANGVQMASARPHLLRDGDRIQVGPVTFTFRQGAETSAGGHAGGGDATRVISDDGTRR